VSYRNDGCHECAAAGTAGAQASQHAHTTLRSS
jgi:hypothetical protein